MTGIPRFMDGNANLIPILSASLVLVAYPAGWVSAVRWRRLRNKASTQTESLAVRRIRAASQEMRTIAMTLHGNAGHMATTGEVNFNHIATAAADMFDMADDLHEFTLQGGARHVLRDETVALANAVDEAIATVNASIGRGRRQWRIAADVSATHCQADRRALRHVLTRVLFVAVRNTSQDDEIDIAVQPDSAGIAVVISHTGTRPPFNDDAETTVSDLRLTLAETLMQAHGGQIRVDRGAHANGLRLTLVLPTRRVKMSSIRAAGAEMRDMALTS